MACLAWTFKSTPTQNLLLALSSNEDFLLSSKLTVRSLDIARTFGELCQCKTSILRGCDSSQYAALLLTASLPTFDRRDCGQTLVHTVASV